MKSKRALINEQQILDNASKIHMAIISQPLLPRLKYCLKVVFRRPVRFTKE